MRCLLVHPAYWLISAQDFFFRNCNHFADDLGRRLSDGNEVDRKFMEDFVIFESESL